MNILNAWKISNIPQMEKINIKITSSYTAASGQQLTNVI